MTNQSPSTGSEKSPIRKVFGQIDVFGQPWGKRDTLNGQRNGTTNPVQQTETLT